METKKKRTLTYILLSAYIGLIFIFIVMIYNLPKWVQQVEVSYVHDVQTALHETIQTADEKTLATALSELQKTYFFEVAVYDQTKIIYRSIPGTARNELRNSLNQVTILYEADGDLAGKTKDYSVWYAIYYPPLQTYVSQMTSYLLGFILLAFILLFSLLIVLNRMLIKPLNQIKQTVGKLERYELENLTLEADDIINEKMLHFASNLNGRIKAVSREHTELEYALQLERERLANMMVIARALIHDLKTPVHQAIIDTDFFNKNNQDVSAETATFLNENIAHLEQTMSLINGALTFVDTDAKQLAEVVDHFDIVELFAEIRRSFQKYLESRLLWLDAIMDEQLLVNINKVTARLIIHNMLSNVVQYANAESDVEFEIYLEAGWLHITCANYANAKNIERIQQSEVLFHAILEEERDFAIPEYVYSTGNGLYLIKELVLMLGGLYELRVEDDERIIVDVRIPQM